MTDGNCTGAIRPIDAERTTAIGNAHNANCTGAILRGSECHGV